MSDFLGLLKDMPSMFKEFCWMPIDILRDPRSDVFEYACAIFMLVLFAILAAFGFCSVYWLLNYVGTSKHKGSGSVAHKSYAPSSTHYIFIGGMLYPQTSPERWDLFIDTGKWKGWISVNRQYWDSVKIGQQVHIEYTLGRIDRAPRLTNIYA